jgi:uncharacterized protein YqgV (UPF0045/DUF77 family)
MVVADIAVVPWYPVDGEPRGYYLVDEAIALIKASGLQYEVGAMSTTVEGPLEEILALVPALQERLFSLGAARVLTTLRIDAQKNGPLTMESKFGKHRSSRPSDCCVVRGRTGGRHGTSPSLCQKEPGR